MPLDVIGILLVNFTSTLHGRLIKHALPCNQMHCFPPKVPINNCSTESVQFVIAFFATIFKSRQLHVR